MLDQKTKDGLSQNFASLKPQIQAAFPGADLSKGNGDPDQLVNSIAQSSGQSKTEVEKQLKQMVGAS